MYNKFENEKAPRKNTKGPPWYDRTLHKTEHLIESLFILIYLKPSICLSTVYLCCLLINKIEAKFLRFFCKKKNKHSSSHQTLIRLEFWNMPLNTEPNFDRLFLSNHSSTNSCVMETALEMTRTSQWRQVIFDLPRPLPPGQDRFKHFPTPGPEKLDLSRRLPGDMVTGQIEPYVKCKTGIVQLIIVLSSSLCKLWPERLSKYLFPCFPNSDHVMVFC